MIGDKTRIEARVTRSAERISLVERLDVSVLR